MTYSTSRVVQILTDWAPYFSQSAWYTDLLVWLSQLVLNLMKLLVDAADTLLDKVYVLFDFTQSEQVTSFLKTFHNYLWIPFAMALLMLGYNLIMNKEETKPKVVQNLLIAVLVITAMPNLMLAINDFTRTATLAVKDSQWGVEETLDSKFTFADRIILDQLTDLRYLNRLNWDADKLQNNRRNNITTKEQLDSLDWTETLWSKGSFDGKLENDEKISDDPNRPDGSKSKFVFDYYLQFDDKTDAVKAVEIEDHSFLTFLIRAYYRYHIDFVAVFITLLASALVLFFASFKAAKLLWELSVHQFLALIFSASDLNTGQRIKAILKSMASIYMTLFLSVVMLKFYLMSASFLNAQNSLPTLVRAFLLLFLALACIDGPNIIERILGIDVGLKSGFHTAAAAFRGGQSLWRGARTAGRAASGAGSSFSRSMGSFFSRNRDNVGGYAPNRQENTSLYTHPTAQNSQQAHNRKNDARSQSLYGNASHSEQASVSSYSAEQSMENATRNESSSMGNADHSAASTAESPVSSNNENVIFLGGSSVGTGNPENHTGNSTDVPSQTDSRHDSAGTSSSQKEVSSHSQHNGTVSNHVDGKIASTADGKTTGKSKRSDTPSQPNTPSAKTAPRSSAAAAKRDISGLESKPNSMPKKETPAQKPLDPARREAGGHTPSKPEGKKPDRATPPSLSFRKDEGKQLPNSPSGKPDAKERLSGNPPTISGTSAQPSDFRPLTAQPPSISESPLPSKTKDSLLPPEPQDKPKPQNPEKGEESPQGKP